MSTNKGFFEFSLASNPLPDRLQTYRLNQKLTDLTLQVGDQQFPVHRLVIEDSSPVLKERLTDQLPVCDLSDLPVSVHVIEDLLTFFYTSRIVITEQNASSLCVTSHHLGVHSLVTATERFLSERLTSGNVFEHFLFSLRPLALTLLREHCVSYVINNFEAVLKDDALLNYSFEELQTLIRELNDRKDESKMKEALFETIMKWVQKDDSRSTLLPTLLRSLPLSGLSLPFLGRVVSSENSIADSQLCSRVLNEAFSEAILNASSKKTAPNTGQQLYCFGGYYGRQAIASSVSMMDQAFQWRACAPMLQARADFAGAALGSKVYLCGGVSADGKLSAVEEYDCETQTPAHLPPMPHPRWACAAAGLESSIYVAGGRDPSGRTLSTVIKYDVGETPGDSWSLVSPMHTARRDHQLVDCRGRLYAIAGGGGNSAVEVYDPGSDQWSAAASTKSAHCWFGATEHEGRIYVCSQYGFEVYSPKSDNWETLTALNYCLGRCLVSMGGKLWAVGGGTSIETASVYVYEPRSGYWMRQPDMDIARMHHCSFVVDC